MGESEHENIHLTHVTRHLEKDFEFTIGMVFTSELEAYHKYVAYAIGKGFGVRKAKIRKNGKGEITRRTFVCNCEGYSGNSSDQVDQSSEKKYERLEVRCGCPAFIRFKVENGVYEVIEYVSKHNHEFIPERQKHMIRCGRIISDPYKGVFADMAKAGIGETMAYNFLANEAGGSKNVNFTLRDWQNFLQSERSNYMSGEDCQSLIDHFTDMQMQNPRFFYTSQFDQEGRLTNLYWRDSLSKFDYDCFGDVVVFDTTYRTDKYNMICAPFVGVNHHWKNTLFGCAFLLDETTCTFIWLFKAFLNSMGNKAPKTIFTDQDHAMEKAIRTVFPNTQHRLCTWHIGKNANQNIPHLYKKPEFKDKYFLKLMYRCKSEDEFEFTWNEMQEEWGTHNISWLQKLYDLRHKWSSAFGRDVLSCGIRSSQRSESTNNVFQKMLSNTLSLVEFVHHYEEQLKRMREIENQDDYSSRGKPKLHISNNDILMHAASVYTRAIFKRFNEEFLQSVSEKICATAFDGLVYTYTLKCKGMQGDNVVRFNVADFSISCECKLFESKGWLCRHALQVLNANISVSAIPSPYILKRWTKKAKEVLVVDISNQVASGPSTLDRFSSLMQKSFAVMNLGAKNEKNMKIAEKHLDATVAEISSYASSVVMTDDSSNDNDNEASSCEIAVLDPHQTKGKEMSYGRLESSSEKKKKKSKKRTPPMQIESRELVVQARHDETHVPNYSRNPNQVQNAFSPGNIGGPIVNLNFHNQVQPPYIMPSGL